jgi:hypothetical protein
VAEGKIVKPDKVERFGFDFDFGCRAYNCSFTTPPIELLLTISYAKGSIIFLFHIAFRKIGKLHKLLKMNIGKNV